MGLVCKNLEFKPRRIAQKLFIKSNLFFKQLKIS